MLTTVNGVNFRQSFVKEIVRNLSEGDTVFLEREPDNAYDPNAIKVFVDDPVHGAVHIGYVAAGTAAELAPIMDVEGLGREAEIVGFFDGALKPTIEVREP